MKGGEMEREYLSKELGKVAMHTLVVKPDRASSARFELVWLGSKSRHWVGKN